MKNILFLIGFILVLGIVFLYFQILADIVIQNSGSESKIESVNDENIRDIINLLEPQDILWDEIKIELNLSDNQLLRLKELVNAERQRDFIIRSIDYINRGVERGDLSIIIGNQRRQELEAEINDLPSLTSVNLSTFLSEFQYKKLIEWISIQRRIQTIMDRVICGKTKTNSEIINEFDLQWANEKEKIDEMINGYTEKEFLYLNKVVGFNKAQNKKILQIIKDNKEKITEIKKQLILAKIDAINKRSMIQQLIDKIKVENDNSKSLLKECLNRTQKERYEMIK